ncbi:MAG: hypothetical protein KDK51_07610 [Deltaproteobacteria bacterium]|nr:hypothetical protein [Deltaproteobacteria bacterium]
MSSFYYSPTRADPYLPPPAHFYTPPPPLRPQITLIPPRFPHEFHSIPPPLFIKPPPNPYENERFPTTLDTSAYDSEISCEFRMTPIKKKAIDMGFPYRNKKKKPAESEIEEAVGDLVYYFKEIIAFESEIEKCREELARKSDFRIAYIFNYFDVNNSHQIIIPELHEGLTKLGIQAKNDDVYMLVKRYSQDNLEKLRFF